MLSPRENLSLIGHHTERDLFLNAFHSARFPHAWILGGNRGIGKATFAFHMSRYILSGRQDKNTVFSDQDPLYRRMVAGSHGDLWTGGETDSEIGVDSIRHLNSFMNQTTAEGGWRAVVIDGAEGLNRNAANALLKRLEEPPPKTVFFLTTPTPSSLLPTLRSRCQLLMFKPLDDEALKEVLQTQGLKIPSFCHLAEGSPGRLMRLMEGDGPQIYADLQRIVAGEPATSFMNSFSADETSYSLIEELLRSFLYNNLMSKVGTPDELKPSLTLYEKVTRLFNEGRFAQLDRRTTLTCVFASLKNGY